MNEGEKKVVSSMIAIYCRSKHSSGKELCEECSALNEYALQRLETCRFGEEKPTCAGCPVHCYKKNMRVKIKEVMRFSGPRMLFVHPIATIRHLYRERKLDRNYTAKTKANKNR